MATNNKVHQIDVERALFPVLDIVCRNLSAKDLLSTAQVCKSWNFIALREKRKRYGIKRLRLPYQMKDLASKLDVVPLASILFYSTSLEQSISVPVNDMDNDNGVNLDLLEDFQTQLPNEMIVLKSDVIFDSELKGKNDILGLFFPSSEERVRVHIAILDSRMSDYNTPDSIAEELGMKDCPYNKSTILLFYSWVTADRRHLAQLCEREQKKGKEITMASVFGTFLSTSQHQSMLPVGSTVALRISGSNVESCSTYIHYLAQDDQIEHKLQKMKEKVKPKRFNVGLIYTRKCPKAVCTHDNHPIGDCDGMMNKLKRFFPDIRFTGFFKNCTDYNPPMFERYDRFDERYTFDEDFLCFLIYYASIVIISYD